MNRTLATFVAVVVIGAVTTLTPREAAACGNSMHRFHELPEVSVVERAWTEIRNGAYSQAIGMLAAEFDDLDAQAARIVGTQNEASPAVQRALHGMALAVVRTKGAWSREASPAALVDDAAAQNVAWATAVLGRLADKTGPITVHYSEALALDPLKRTQARLGLEQAAGRGELVDPASWQLLGELRRQNGDANAREAFDRANVEPRSKSILRKRKSRSAKVAE